MSLSVTHPAAPLCHPSRESPQEGRPTPSGPSETQCRPLEQAWGKGNLQVHAQDASKVPAPGWGVMLLSLSLSYCRNFQILLKGSVSLVFAVFIFKSRGDHLALWAARQRRLWPETSTLHGCRIWKPSPRMDPSLYPQPPAGVGVGMGPPAPAGTWLKPYAEKTR